MTELQKRDAMKKILATFGGEWVDLPTFLPSETVLELSGESLRPRLYFANTPDGREICLRPDLTMPAAVHFIENHAHICGEKTYLCSGKVFRANEIPDFKAHEFRQMGIEHFGGTDPQIADVSLFLTINQACDSVRNGQLHYEFFDGGLVRNILQNAQIDEVWRAFLLDGCFDFESLKSRLEIAISGQKPQISALAQSLVEKSDVEAEKIVTEVVGIAKLRTYDAHNAADIAKRLKQKARRAMTKPLSNQFAQDFLALMAIEDAPMVAIEEIKNAAQKIGVDLVSWYQNWQEKFEKIDAQNSNILKNAKFNAAKFGRFEYYDGFAFEIFARDLDRALASGGRYNGMIAQLSSGKFDINAVGAVIRPQLLLGE